jgi:hypothetical protein
MPGFFWVSHVLALPVDRAGMQVHTTPVFPGSMLDCVTSNNILREGQSAPFGLVICKPSVAGR